jgi:hypothetical protein
LYDQTPSCRVAVPFANAVPYPPRWTVLPISTNPAEATGWEVKVDLPFRALHATEEGRHMTIPSPLPLRQHTRNIARSSGYYFRATPFKCFRPCPATVYIVKDPALKPISTHNTDPSSPTSKTTIPLPPATSSTTATSSTLSTNASSAVLLHSPPLLLTTPRRVPRPRNRHIGLSLDRDAYAAQRKGELQHEFSLHKYRTNRPFSLSLILALSDTR